MKDRGIKLTGEALKKVIEHMKLDHRSSLTNAAENLIIAGFEALHGQSSPNTIIAPKGHDAA